MWFVQEYFCLRSYTQRLIIRARISDRYWKAVSRHPLTAGVLRKLTLRLLMSHVYIYIYIYIYIYDISSLRVNDLTLILLTWRKW